MKSSPTLNSNSGSNANLAASSANALTASSSTAQAQTLATRIDISKPLAHAISSSKPRTDIEDFVAERRQKFHDLKTPLAAWHGNIAIIKTMVSDTPLSPAIAAQCDRWHASYKLFEEDFKLLTISADPNLPQRLQNHLSHLIDDGMSIHDRVRELMQTYPATASIWLIKYSAALAEQSQILRTRSKDLQDFCDKYSQTGYPLVKESGDMRNLVKSIVLEFLAQSGTSNKSLNLDLGDEPLIANYSAARMEHVVRNLISNAHKHTYQTIDVRMLQLADGFIQLQVRDNGPQDPKHIPLTSEQIGNFFNYGVENPNRSADSTGVGLYDSKYIVEAHNGTIRAEQDRQFTTLTVLIPVE